jgi:hypothetical protein
LESNEESGFLAGDGSQGRSKRRSVGRTCLAGVSGCEAIVVALTWTQLDALPLGVRVVAVVIGVYQ